MDFLGEKIKLARILNNLTITELAQKLDISKQSVSQYEIGSIAPKTEMQFKIVTTLGFPREFYQIPIAETVNTRNTFFRALSTTTNLDKKTQEEKSKIVIQLYNFLCNYLEFPNKNLPQFDLPEDISQENVEHIATKLRDFWHLANDPIENMIELFEVNGIIVSKIKVGNKTIDAFTQMHEVNGLTEYCVNIGDKSRTQARCNFSLAHELGHIILHSNIMFLDEMSREERNKIEHEADLFASAFLLPKEAFFYDLKTPTVWESYIELKKKWHTSMSAMMMRAKTIGRLNNYQYQNLFVKEHCIKKKCQIEEPLDKTMPIKKPILFKKSLELLLDNNIFTVSELQQELGKRGLAMHLKDLEEYMSLGYNFFSKYQISKKPKLYLQLKPIIN